MLHQLRSTPQGHHYREARRRDREAKANEFYDKMHGTRQRDVKLGDLAHWRNRQTSPTRGLWDREPHTVTKVVHNQITSTRNKMAS